MDTPLSVTFPAALGTQYYGATATLAGAELDHHLIAEMPGKAHHLTRVVDQPDRRPDLRELRLLGGHGALGSASRNRHGQPGRSARPLLLLVNAGNRALDFQLPPGPWQPLLDSSVAPGLPDACSGPTAAWPLPARSVVLLQLNED